MILILSFVMMFSFCMPVFAAQSVSETDEQMKVRAEEIIDKYVPEGNREDEKKYLDSFNSKLTGVITIESEGVDVIEALASELNLDFTAWKAKFRDACNTYNVPHFPVNKQEDLAEGNAAKNATSKLHILQWDADTEGVNRSALKTMLTDILSNSALKNVMGICMSFGAALCIAFGAGDIISKATEKSVSSDMVWRAFLKMCVGLFFIFNCLYIASAIIYVGNLLLTAALDNVTFVTPEAAYEQRAHLALWDSLISIEESGGLSKMGSLAASGNSWILKPLEGMSTFFDTIGDLGSGITSGIGNFFANVPVIGGLLSVLSGSGIIEFATSLTVYAVAIDLGIRFVFTPIAVADLFSERFRSTGVKWLKSIAASSMQGVIIFVIVIVGTSLKNSLESGTLISGFSPVTSTVVNLTMIGLFAKSRGFAQEIVGVH